MCVCVSVLHVISAAIIAIRFLGVSLFHQHRGTPSGTQLIPLSVTNGCGATGVCTYTPHPPVVLVGLGPVCACLLLIVCHNMG